MSENITKTQNTCHASFRNNGGYHNTPAGFRMTGTIRDIMEGQIFNDQQCVKITVGNLATLSGKPMKQNTVVAIGDRIGSITPEAASIGDEIQFVGNTVNDNTVVIF